MAEIHQLVGVYVDKEELIKALQYYRNQYEKGYSDGRESIVEELKEIKAELQTPLLFVAIAIFHYLTYYTVWISI